MPDKSAALFRASNVVTLDYSLEGSLVSALGICDEAIVVVDKNSRDGTLGLVYSLQRSFGADRVIVVEREWLFDRMWQERCWAWASNATDAEWLMFHDADEALHEHHIAEIHETMERPDVKLVRFPFIHLYGTPRYHHHFPLTHNTRLGRRSAGYKMRNWCTDAQPHRAVCQMVFGPHEANAHAPGPGIVTLEGVLVMHYGWCRSARALAISQAKQGAWYADGAGLEDGRIPDIAPFNFEIASKWGNRVHDYDGAHPAGMAKWFAAHAAEWEVLDG